MIITYDDSDGWYDHVLAPITTQSQTALDTLTGAGACGSQLKQVPVNSANQPEQGRCGLGVRMPFLVISPWAKRNFVDNSRGRDRPRGRPPPPRADPSVRHYRTGLLPWVVAAKRISGNGCRMRVRGSHRVARRFIRFQVSRVRWLRRRSA